VQVGQPGSQARPQPSTYKDAELSIGAWRIRWVGVSGVVVENLTSVERIDFADPLITVFPLRLTGADGGPTRATAIDLRP
jgi:hypothetical protein